MVRAITSVTLRTPHIPLDVELSEGLRILAGLQTAVVEDVASERSFRADTPQFSVAIYPDGSNGDRIRSVWYDDRAARETDAAKHAKVLAYLARYGVAEHWEMRMDNGWMRYWFNPSDEAAMVYGVHADVIRFNRWRQPAGG